MQEHAPAPQIVSTTTFCQNFPAPSSNEISRTNILHTLATMFEGDTEAVVVHGKEGSGRTTLLAQFARLHSDRAISIFIRASSRFGYDPELIMTDMCSQIEWLLRAREEGPVPTYQTLSKLIHDLQRSCSRLKPFYYLVVDGLTEIPGSDVHLKDQILALLPTGLSQFRFLMSAASARPPIDKLNTMRVSTLPLSGFTPGETKAFLGLGLSSEISEELYTVTKGAPGHLATIKRLMEGGIKPSELIEQLPSSQPGLFEMEWKAVNPSDELQIRALALLAHDRTKHTVSDLCTFLKCDNAQLCSALRPLSFIVLPGNNTSEVTFASESFRQFAAIQLADWKRLVNNLVIETLLEDPHSDQTVMRLPGYLELAGKDTELLNYLTPDHFAAILEHSRSMSAVQQHASLGLSAALKLSNDGELLRFGIHESAMVELDAFAASRAEIRARVALGQQEAALALAHSAALKHDRLRLLAALARANQARGIRPDNELVEQILQLLKEVDVRDLGSGAVDLATDLMHFKPDAAIKVVERMSKSSSTRSVDYALARLSVIGSVANEQERQASRQAAESARSKIKDPDLFKVSTAVSLFIGEYSASEIITEVEKLSKPADRLYMLRQWALNAQDFESAPEVIEYAFKLAIRTIEYTPTATHMRELATPLPMISRVIPLKRVIALIDSLKARAEELGPTEEFVRLQLLVAEAEGKYDRASAVSRLFDMYLYIDQRIQDSVTRTSCLASFLTSIIRTDTSESLESSFKLRSLVEEELNSQVSSLLANTAEQFVVLKPVLEALAIAKSDLALSISSRFNVETRRDDAYATIARQQGEAAPSDISFPALATAIDAVKAEESKHDLLSEFLGRIAREKRITQFVPRLDELLPFINQATEIGDMSERARACAYSIRILKAAGNNQHLGLIDRLKSVLRSAWNAIDDEWQKVEVGYAICSSLADYDREFASQYMRDTDAFRKEIPLRESDTSFAATVSLGIRAFGGLIANDLESEVDLEQLLDRVHTLPSQRQRVRCLTELALRFFSQKKHQDGRKIVNDHIKTLLAGLRANNPAQWARSTTVAAPALYLSNPTLGLESISLLPSDWRDTAYDEVADFILRKVPSSDPYESSGKRYSIEYEEAVDVCNVVQQVCTDWIIYRHVEHLVESLNWKMNRRISAEHKADIARRLTEIVNLRLPTARFIAHEGFKIVCLAQISRLRRIPENGWKELVEKGRSVPNSADRAMVLCILARCAASVSEQQSLFNEARTTIESIPSVLDRVDRLHILADECSDLDPVLCKSVLRHAIKVVAKGDDPAFRAVQRRIIDLAYRMNKEFASSLVSELDTDPARRAARQAAKNQQQLLELKHKLTDESEDAAEVLANEPSAIGRAAWSSLGSLNSGRSKPLNMVTLRPFIQKAARWSLQESYPVFSWVIENAVRRIKGDAAGRTLRGIFGATILGCDLISRILRKSAQTPQTAQGFVMPSMADGTVLVRAGERDRALKHLGGWLQKYTNRYLKICDPFIGPEDAVVILQMVLETAPGLQVSFLTSRKHQESAERTTYEEAFSREWHRNFDQEPPDAQLVIAGTRPGGDSPIHDRWWITDGAGLRLGTSFNSLGVGKDSEISVMRYDEVRECEDRLDRYLQGLVRVLNGQRIDLVSFPII